MTSFVPKSTKPSFFVQNQLKPVFRSKPHFFQSKLTKTTILAKINQTHFFWSQLTKTTFSRQNRPKPPFSAKFDQNDFFWSETRSSAQIDQEFFRSKSTKTNFSGQKPVFSVKIDQNTFLRSKLTKPGFFCQKPVFFSQSQRKPLFVVQNQFCRPKPTKTSPFF